MERVIAYIDGFNLYYGLRQKGWRRYLWLNLGALVQSLLRPGQILTRTRYFTTLITSPADKYQRQASYLDALRTLPNLDIFFGHYLADSVTCRTCGHTHVTYHEKMTDVNIAVQLITDAHSDAFDTALLVSGDSDLTPALHAVRSLCPTKRIVVAFPPCRSSVALKSAAHGYLAIGQNHFRHSLLPDPVIASDGHPLSCPASWH